MTVLQIFEEIWIPVKGYEGFYECSTEGRIRSVGRLLPATIKRGPYFRDGVVLSETNINPDGYNVATLYKGSKKLSKTATFHTFIFYSFNPEASPKKGYEIDHHDNDKSNNRPSNLKQITSRKNSSKRSMQKKKTSIYTGVWFDEKRNKYKSCIRIKGKSKYLGRFDTEIEASNAYQNALKNLISI